MKRTFRPGKQAQDTASYPSRDQEGRRDFLRLVGATLAGSLLSRLVACSEVENHLSGKADAGPGGSFVPPDSAPDQPTPDAGPAADPDGRMDIGDDAGLDARPDSAQPDAPPDLPNNPDGVPFAPG